MWEVWDTSSTGTMKGERLLTLGAFRFIYKLDAKEAVMDVPHYKHSEVKMSMDSIVNELANCKVQWKSCTSLILRHLSGDSKIESDIRKQIGMSSMKDLQDLTMRLCQSANQTIESVDRLDIYCLVLKVASVSISEHATRHEAVTENVIQIWVEESEVLYIINELFDEPHEDIAEYKKLALDLGFVITSRMLYFGGPCFGLAAPVKHWQHQLLLIFGKLLESFMVTTPPHFPFMPAKHFSSICWPVVVQESCSGKVHSIVTFLPVISNKSSTTSTTDVEDRSSESSAERKDEVKYCNFEVVARRQPWKGMVSALQLYQLAQLLVDCKKAAPSDNKAVAIADGTVGEINNRLATSAECEGVLHVLRNVFQRIATVDTALLSRDPLTAAPIGNDDACSCPAEAHSTAMAHANPFAVFAKTVLSLTAPTTSSGRTDRDIVKERCRLCAEATCPSCTAQERWMDGRVCTTCHPLLQELGLLHVRPKKSRTLLAPRAPNPSMPMGGTSTADRNVVFAVPTLAALARAGGSMGTTTTAAVGGVADGDCSEPEGGWGEAGGDDEDPLEDRQEEEDTGEDGRYSPCCSETMTDSLRSWRDGADTDEEGEEI